MANPSSRRKTLSILLGLFLILFVFFFYWFLFKPSPATSLTKSITIKKGMPIKKISMMLEQEGIIRNRHFFTGMATLLGGKAGIKAGEYEFKTAMPAWEVLNALVKGHVKHHLITIPEGYTLFQIAQYFGDLDIVSKEAFLQMATSPFFINSLGLSEVPLNQYSGGILSTLEGYLFPETYSLVKEMPPEEVIQMMVRQFKKVFGLELAGMTSQPAISPRDVVILASIIEKETPLSEEKPLISAVFHNRLKKKIPLQSDPTVIYGIKNFNGNLTKKDLL